MVCNNITLKWEQWQKPKQGSQRSAQLSSAFFSTSLADNQIIKSIPIQSVSFVITRWQINHVGLFDMLGGVDAILRNLSFVDKQLYVNLMNCLYTAVHKQFETNLCKSIYLVITNASSLPDIILVVSEIIHTSKEPRIGATRIPARKIYNSRDNTSIIILSLFGDIMECSLVSTTIPAKLDLTNRPQLQNLPPIFSVYFSINKLEVPQIEKLLSISSFL